MLKKLTKKEVEKEIPEWLYGIDEDVMTISLFNKNKKVSTGFTTSTNITIKDLRFLIKSVLERFIKNLEVE